MSEFACNRTERAARTADFPAVLRLTLDFADPDSIPDIARAARDTERLLQGLSE